jgi:phenylacetate 2-hydroxylase
MVAAGLDTLPGNINMTIAYLSSPHGQEIQQQAYAEIMKAYEGEDPWEMCIQEEKCAFMVSFVKVRPSSSEASIQASGAKPVEQEVLRFWSTLNMSFTRESIKPIEYKGAVIPEGTPFFMVSTPFLTNLPHSTHTTIRTCGPRTTTPRISKTR